MFKGSFVAIVTPMKEDFSIDYARFEKLIEFHIENKTDGIVVVGTTGESPTLSYHEHKEVVKFCIQKVARRVPVIAGAGSNNTKEAIDLATFAKQAKADASLQITPYYNKPSQKGLLHHFNLIAKQVAMPHILYNVPSRTNCDLLPETTIELSKIDNIVGIKEAAFDGPKRVKVFTEAIDSEFSILSGEDGTLLEFMQNGGHGVISVTANIAPKQMHELLNLCLKEEFKKANVIQEGLIDLHKMLFSEPSPSPLKWAMKQLSLVEEFVRSPLIEFTEENQQAMLLAMKKAKLI